MKILNPEAEQVVVSLADFSGRWASPYAEAGYRVILLDLKHGDDLLTTATRKALVVAVGAYRVSHMLAAPPCTDFAVSGAQYWTAKDRDGRTAHSVALIRACLAIRDDYAPLTFRLENPAGRLPRLVPELGDRLYAFHPHHFAGWAPDPESDRYTKYTIIWGHANEPQRRPLPPIMHEVISGNGQVKRGSVYWAKLGGKSERTKTLRSMTPLGFARADFIANP